MLAQPEVQEAPDPRLLGTNGSLIASYLMEMAKSGYRQQTILSHGQILRLLDRHCSLADPETVRTYLLQAHVTPGRKENIVNCYARFGKSRGIAFEKPRYQRQDSLPKIPQDQELQDVMNASRYLRHATALRLLYETGMRAGELHSLTFRDFDFVRGTVSVKPEKHSRAREHKLSPKLVAMVQEVFQQSPERPFPNPPALKKHLHRTTHYLAKLHTNPRYLEIHCHTFRHYRACRLYSETKDILYVKNWLGHRSITSTMKYLQITDLEDPQYVVKAARTSDEASPLIEQGFSYQCSTQDGTLLFRKRK